MESRMLRRVILPIALLAILSHPGIAEICQDCYEKPSGLCGPRGGDCVDDASCCITDGSLCTTLSQDPDWWLAEISTTWCTEVWVNGVGYSCRGDTLSCSPEAPPGGGGGGDSCVVKLGEWCPPSCTSCTRVLF